MTTDYEAVELPDGDPSPEWHWTERRSYLLNCVKACGSPSRINRRSMGERFGVTGQQISQDMDALGEYLADSAGGTRAVATAAMVYQKTVNELLAAEEWKDAAAVTSDWMDWLQETGRQETAPDKHAHAVNTNVSRKSIWERDDIETDGHLHPQNEAHFERLTQEAEEATESCTVTNPGSQDHDHDAADAERRSDGGRERDDPDPTLADKLDHGDDDDPLMDADPATVGPNTAAALREYQRKKRQEDDDQ